MAEAENTASTLASTLAVRLSEHAVVGMDDERILIGNRDTGAYSYWCRAEEDGLGRYMSWRTVQDIVAEAASGTETEETAGAAINAELDRLAGLLRIGVLDDRDTDLSGERLAAPGPAWEPAMRFLMETRTTAETIFAIPEDYNEMLAEPGAMATAALGLLRAPRHRLPATERSLGTR